SSWGDWHFRDVPCPRASTTAALQAFGAAHQRRKVGEFGSGKVASRQLFTCGRTRTTRPDTPRPSARNSCSETRPKHRRTSLALFGAHYGLLRPMGEIIVKRGRGFDYHCVAAMKNNSGRCFKPHQY